MSLLRVTAERVHGICLPALDSLSLRKPIERLLTKFQVRTTLLSTASQQ